MATVDDFSRLVDDATYIPKQPFIITTAIFLAFTLLSITLRLFLRLRHNITLHLDDFILLISVLCLLGGTAALHVGLADIYLATAISANPSPNPSPPTSDIIAIAIDALRYRDAFHCLVWTSIFAVKISFICFFRQFVGGLASASKRVNAYWWGTLVVMVGGWAFTLSVPFIACSHRGGEAALQCSGPRKEPTVRILAYANAAVDCLTTILILSFPALITRNLPTRTTRFQKASLVTLTSLSFLAIILSITRAIIHTRDIPFQAHLTYLEACLALLAVSLTTYKSLFAPHSPNSQQQQRDGTKLRWRPGTLTQRRRTESQEQLHFQHPRRATPPSDNAFPGLSTFIEGGTIRTPSRLTKTSLRRKESVLRTREVVVEVHYEKDLEEGNRDRLASPSWMEEKWKIRRSSESCTSGT